MPEAEVIEGEATEVEEVRQLPAVRAHEALVAKGEITVEELVAQADKIKQVMDAAMTDGIHYGKIPGISKPTLLKPGAEKLNVVLRLAPSYKSERTFHDGGHLTVVSLCTLTHIQTGLTIAEGEGLCSTHESKYAYRQGGRTCPACGAVGTIKKSKFPPRASDYPGANPSDPPGWYCHAKVDGCGANFAASDPAIIAQEEVGRVDNPDLPDLWNTVLKMADKRALIAAVLNGTAASDVFTQDAEDSRGREAPSDAPISRENAGGGSQAPERPFDVSQDLLEGAIKPGRDMASRLGEQMRHLNPGLDWNAMIRQVWTTERTPEFWIRLSNCLTWIERTSGMDKADFPLVDDTTVVAGFAYAFDGQVVEVVELEAAEAPIAAGAAPEPDDEIEFGESTHGR